MGASDPSLLSRARPLVLARGAAALLSFVIPLALARALTQDEYGTYKLLLLIASTLYATLPMGMAQSLFYFVPRAPQGRAYLFQVLTFLAAVGLLALAGLTWGSGLLAGWFGNPRLAAYALPLGLFTLGLIVSVPLEVTLTARGQTGRAAAAYLVSDAVKAALMAGPAFLGFGLPGVAAGLGAFGLVRVCATWLALPGGREGPRLDRARLRSQLSYALPFGAAMLVAIPTQYFHQYVVAARLDPAAFAVYAVGLFQLPVVELLYTPTSEIIMVRVGELEREGRVEAAGALFREAVGKLAGVFVPLTVFLWVVAPELITALFTARYAESVPVFRVVVLATLLACLPVDGLLRARDQTRHIFLSYALKAALAVPLVLFSVSRFGMMGAVASWLAAEAFGKAVLFSRLPSVLGVRTRDLLPFRELGLSGASAVLALGGIFAARALAGGLHPAPLVACDALLYGVGFLAASAVVGSELPLGIGGVLRRAWGWVRVRVAA